VDVSHWRAAAASPEAVADAIACVRSPRLAHVWRQPERGEVWRERAFEIVLDEAWITGVFDRVVIERDARGRATSVAVFDFKTDRVTDDASVRVAMQRHGGQLNLYRRVAAAMTAVEPGVVAAEVVFTRLQRAERVPG
jgi:ATP-dependent helicase/nuclease subunit A